MTSYNFEQTFETFVVGDTNRSAYTVCKAMVDNLPLQFNPLFIYGKSGVGKTHLVRSIEKSIISNDANKKIIFVKGEDYISQLIDSLRNNSIHAFRDHYRNCDILILEDIHFFEGKTVSQEELLRTITTLVDNEKQVILTSNCAPKHITPIDEHLMARLHH